MKTKKIFLASILLLVILTIGAVSAAEDANLTASNMGEDMVVESSMVDVEVNDSDLGTTDDFTLSKDPDLNVELENNVGEYNGYFNVKVTRSSKDACEWNRLIAYMDKNDDEWGDNEYTIYDDTPQNFDLKIAVGEAEFGSHTVYVEHWDYDDNLVKKFTFPVTVAGFYMDVFTGEDTEWGDDIKIHFNMPLTAVGTINFTFNGKKYVSRSDDYKRDDGYDEEMFDYDEWIESEGSQFNAIIKKEDVICGINNIVATYTPASKYSPFKEKTINTNLTVLSKIHFSTDSVDYGGKDTITLALPSDATGKLLVSIGGKNYTVNHDNGKYTFNYSLLDLGNYEVEARYTGHDYNVDYGLDWIDGHPLNFTSESITIRPYLDIARMIWDREKLDISVRMPSKYNGKVTLLRDSDLDYDYDLDDGYKISDDDIVLGTATIKNGIATVSFKVGPGEHEILAYVECGDYKGISNRKPVEVVYESSQWDMNLKNIQNMIMKGDNQYLAELGELPAHINIIDNLVLKIDGFEFKEYLIDDSEWLIDINSSKLSYGKHSFELIFLGDGYFEPKSVSGFFEVGNAAVYIPKELDVDRSLSDFHVLIPKAATGTVTFYVDDKKRDSVRLSDDYEYYDDENYLSFGFDFYVGDLSCGSHKVSIIKDAGNYQFRVDAEINVNYTLKSGESVMYGGDSLPIFAPRDKLEKLSVKIDGVSYVLKSSDYDSDYYVNIPSNLAPGIHDIVLSYSGDKIHPARTVKSTFEVIPTVIYNGEYINYGEGISLAMPNDAKGNLVVLIDNKLFKSVKANGNVFIPMDNAPFGYVKMDVMYDGDDYYVRTDKPNPVTFTKFKVPERIFLGEGEVSISLPSDVPAKLKVEYYDSNDDYKTIEKDLVNGKATISLSKLPYGSNSIWVSLEYLEDEEYDILEEYSTSFYIYVVKPIVTSGSSAVYSSNYKIKIQDINKKPISKASVTVLFDGKKVGTVKTDSKGYAYYKVSQAPKSSYAVKLVYGKYSTSFKLKVTHAVSLKTAAVKKSAKKLVLTATLKKINGKYLKNKKLTFKFNGKKYTAKTNAKGVAKLTIKKATLKKLKVGKKIAYQVTYGKDTVKKTAKVKK